MDFFAKMQSLKDSYFKNNLFLQRFERTDKLFIQPPDTSIQHMQNLPKLNKVKINNDFINFSKVNVGFINHQPQNNNFQSC
jgi:hypothetical protein